MATLSMKNLVPALILIWLTSFMNFALGDTSNSTNSYQSWDDVPICAVSYSTFTTSPTPLASLLPKPHELISSSPEKLHHRNPDHPESSLRPRRLHLPLHRFPSRSQHRSVPRRNMRRRRGGRGGELLWEYFLL